MNGAPHPVSEIDIGKHRRLIEALLGAPQAVVLVSPAGDAVAGAADDAELLAAARRACASGADASRHPGVPERLASGREARLCWLRDTQGDPLALLAVACGDSRAPADAEPAARALESVGECVLAELRLTRELSDMAEELGERYEELNLVFAADERAQGYDAGHGRGVLEQLVEDCGVYLGVDGVALELPGEQLSIRRREKPADPGSPVRLRSWSRARDEALWLVQRRGAAVVVNGPDDANLSESLGLKLIAAPIYDATSQVVGVLAIFRQPSRPDFANSDRRMMDVLAEQASAVLKSRQDATTGALNRRGLEHRLADVLEGAVVARTLMQVDIDDFKIVNDAAGRAAGDEMLRQIAGLLRGGTREADLVARLGADEFAVLLEGCDGENALAKAREIQRMLGEHRFAWEGKIFQTSVSAGVVEVSPDVEDASELLAMADTACTVAKRQGHGSIHVYREDDEVISAERGAMRWVPRINRALADDRFTLHAQRIEPLAGAEREPETLYELLVRLVDEKGKIVPPGAFLPAAERYQLSPEIDRWVIRHALRRIAAHRELLAQRSIAFTINLSGHSLVQANLLPFICGEIEAAGVGFESICFEITETLAISNFSAAVRLMSGLRRRGCRFLLDDFGTGVSSFSYLKNLPIQFLKIDGCFVKGLRDDSVSAAVITAIRGVAEVMGLKTVAEFVEDDATRARLREIGVDYGQGFGIAMPRPLDVVLAELPRAGASRAAASATAAT